MRRCGRGKVARQPDFRRLNQPIRTHHRTLEPTFVQGSRVCIYLNKGSGRILAVQR
jgi:hypothetical protein